jgi:hypothetical protein
MIDQARLNINKQHTETTLEAHFREIDKLVDFYKKDDKKGENHIYKVL